MQEDHWKAYLPDMQSINFIHSKSKCIAMVSFADQMLEDDLVDENFEMEFRFLENRIEH